MIHFAEFVFVKKYKTKEKYGQCLMRQSEEAKIIAR